jgi:hypothetical protein
LNRPGFAVFTMTKVVKRRMSAPADTMDDFVAFGRDLLLKAGSFQGQVFLFLFWGINENLTQMVQIVNGNIKPTIVARRLVEKLKPDSFVLVYESWALILGPKQEIPATSIADRPDRREALIFFYCSRTKKRFLRQMFHHDERDGAIKFDELIEDKDMELSGLIGDMKIPGADVYQ